MAKRVTYEVSINDPAAKDQKYVFSLAVPDDMSDEAIADEVRRHAMTHAVNITWRKVDFIGPKRG